MDTSEQYIKMCEKAEEIQEYFDEWDDDVVLVCSVCRTRYGNCISHPPESGKNELEHTMIKLPRQDQLQEMVGGLERGFILWRDWLPHIYGENYFAPFKDWKFKTYEQLWLAFVMREKYDKVWDGEDWIKV